MSSRRRKIAIKRRSGALYTLVRRTFERYQREHGDLLGAGLAFYALLSAAPMAWLAVTVASLTLERERARSALIASVRNAAGADVAHEAAELLRVTRELVGGSATWIAAALLLWAASRFFVQLQVVLNVMWGVRAASGLRTTRVVKQLAVKRVMSFLMVIACGVLLLGSVLLHALLSALVLRLQSLADRFHVDLSALVAQDAIASMLLMTLMLAGIYRILPDARIPWRDVWVGAISTALLIAGGTALLSVYLGQQTSSVVHGALGSFAAFALWGYYLSQVFVVGAAFTRVWAERSHGSVTPEPYAELVDRPTAAASDADPA